MKPRIRKLYLLGVTVLVIASLLTSVQVARAWSPPSGCWITSYVNDCGRCGFLWLNQYWRHTWNFACPDGHTGIYQEKGPCGSC